LKKYNGKTSYGAGAAASLMNFK